MLRSARDSGIRGETKIFETGVSFLGEKKFDPRLKPDEKAASDRDNSKNVNLLETKS